MCVCVVDQIAQQLKVYDKQNVPNNDHILIKLNGTAGQYAFIYYKVKVPSGHFFVGLCKDEGKYVILFRVYFFKKKAWGNLEKCLT